MRPLRIQSCVLLLVGTSFSLLASAQIPETDSTVPPAPQIKLLRFEEDWSSLCHKVDKEKGVDRLKYIELGPTCGARYLSLGGELRGVFEHVQNDNWIEVPYPTNTFGLERFQFHADLHLLPQVRFFIQVESGLEQGRPGGPRPIDEKRLDFLNAFVELHPSSRASAPTLRAGRQELNFGSGRLVAVREGPNVRQSFYAFRVDEAVRSWAITGFAARPAADNPGYFDNVPLQTTTFWGVFAERSRTREATHFFDLYYFGLDRKQPVFNRGPGHEVRQTFGARIALEPGTISSNRSTNRMILPHFDLEAVGQLGSFTAVQNAAAQGMASVPIHAWTIATEVGMVLAKTPSAPRIGLRADVASGDSGHGALGTFNPLFPIGNYFGVLADTGPGPINFYDIHPDARFSLPHGVSLDADWVFWWRQNQGDGVYGVPGNLLVSADKSSARFVGQRPGTEVRWQMTPHAYVQADYGVFYAGSFLKESGRPHNLNYTSFWLGYKF